MSDRLAALYLLRARVAKEIRALEDERRAVTRAARALVTVDYDLTLTSRGTPRKRAAVALCGTESGYYRHRREGTAPCLSCLGAHSVGERERAERRKMATP